MSNSQFSQLIDGLQSLSRNLYRVQRRLDAFEYHCNARFDFLDQEVASLRHQAYHPPSPPATNVSYRPHHDRAPSQGTHDPSPVDSPPSQPLLYTADFQQPDYHSSHHYPPDPPVPAPADPAPASEVPLPPPVAAASLPADPEVPPPAAAIEVVPEIAPEGAPEVASALAPALPIDLPVIPPTAEPQLGSLPSPTAPLAFDLPPALPHTSPP